MSAARVAARYARALIETLGQENALDDVAAFVAFCDMAAGHRELSALFANVTVSAQDKADVTGALAKKMALPETVSRFVSVLALNGRMGILDDVKKAVVRALDERRNVRNVMLTTAVSPSEDELGSFRKGMEQALGHKVRLDSREDPSIMGGAIARVGSVVYDGSVRGQLSRLRKELMKEN